VTLLILPILIAIVVTKIMSDSVSIIINDDSYVVQQGAEKIVLPRGTAHMVQRVDKDVAVIYRSDCALLPVRSPQQGN
jgi:hypothetical protein